MTTRKNDQLDAPRRGRGDDGAAMVEFAFVGGLLLLLVFGIINFGLILSFRQDVTRAAAEGARGGAVANVSPTYPSIQVAAREAADSAVQDAVEAIGGRFDGAGCDAEGMSCSTPVVAPCLSQPAYQCVTVTVSYDYDEHPLYGDLPFMSAFLPDTIEATSVARINS